MTAYIIVIGAVAVGLIVGLAATKMPLLRLVATALIIAAYVALVVGVGIYAAQCWDCTVGTEDNRRIALAGIAIFYGALALAIVAGIWVAAGVVAVLRKHGATSVRNQAGSD